MAKRDSDDPFYPQNLIASDLYGSGAGEVSAEGNAIVGILLSGHFFYRKLLDKGDYWRTAESSQIYLKGKYKKGE